MIVLQQFYQIIESKTSKVSSFWKVAHIFVALISAVCGFLTAFTFGRVLNIFRFNCVIYADVVFEQDVFLNQSTMKAIDVTDTIWGNQHTCNFVHFTPLVISISAIIWGIYFGILSKGGAGFSTDLLSKPWSVIVICIVFTFIFSIVYIVSTVHLHSGMKEFCLKFKPIFNNTQCVPEMNRYAEQFYKGEQNRVEFFQFYANTKVAIVSSVIGVCSWALQLLLCILRIFCVVDFDLQLVTVMTKEEEVVEKIIEFTDEDQDSQV